MTEMSKDFHLRINQETLDMVEEIMRKYPLDYPTHSSVVRAGIYTLLRWKHSHDVLYKDHGIMDSEGRE